MKEKNGEHPLGDSGQLVLLVVFLIVWVADSFFLRISAFLPDYIPLYIRLVILGLMLVTAVYLIRWRLQLQPATSPSVVSPGSNDSVKSSSSFRLSKP